METVTNQHCSVSILMGSVKFLMILTYRVNLKECDIKNVNGKVYTYEGNLNLKFIESKQKERILIS